MMYELTIIIPFRCENKSSNYLFIRINDLLDELATQIQNLPIEVLVVDTGSSEDIKNAISKKCNEYAFSYFYKNQTKKAFSIGECRDIGAEIAQGKAITFMDVDLRVDSDFWRELLVLMKNWGINKQKKSFLAIPCIYLSSQGTEEFAKHRLTSKYLYLQYLQGIKDNVESFALCSSVMIVNRDHYLEIGGHDKEFRGHGYEDFELYNRLLGEEKIIPIPNNYLLDKKVWDTSTFEGFRSRFTLIARPALLSNLQVIHLWHPRPKSASFYDDKLLQRNRILWQTKFENYLKTGTLPEPLVNKNKNYIKALFFGKPDDNAQNCIRGAQPHLGEFIYASEYDFFNQEELFLEEDFKYFLKSLQIEIIVFPNPYGNTKRLAIYSWAKKNNYPFTVFERGALPDSWFFDNKGFNYDSESYCEHHWKYTDLDQKEKQQIDEYIDITIQGKEVLEAQDIRIGIDAIREKLKTGKQKVLFVPLQRPSDTVIKYFCGNIGTYENFLRIVDEIAGQLKSKGWKTYCKKHPLETTKPALKNVIWVPDNTNFIDLVELSDAVALINSGVGIYAMLAQKPCYIFGNAFYCFDGINQKITTEEIENPNRIVDKILKGSSVDYELVRKFVFYLKNKFYSFGKAKTIARKEKDGSLRTITTGIDFYKLCLCGDIIYEYDPISRKQLSLDAPLFERFALDIINRRKSASPQKATPPSTKQSTTNKTENLKKENISQTKDKLQRVSKEQTTSRLWSKFRRDPYRYCIDSKYFLLRKLSFLFK